MAFVLATACTFFSAMFVFCLQLTRSLEDSASTPKLGAGRVTIAQIKDKEVSIRVDHTWEDLQTVVWLVKSKYILPHAKYPQLVERDAISIRIPLEQIKSYRTFPGPLITLMVAVGEDIFGFQFNVLDAIISRNKTFESSTYYGEIREQLRLYPVDVTPSDSVFYTPGDVLFITVKSNNETEDGRAIFYSVNPNPGKSDVVSYVLQRDLLARDPDNPFSVPEPFKERLQINSTSLKIGGVIFITLMHRSSEATIHQSVTLKVIKLTLQEANMPIPEGRVGILKDLYVNQTIQLEVQQGQVSCEAIGNPTPVVEILIDGHPVDTVSAHWVYSVRSMITVYDIPAQQLIDGRVTCHASNDGDDAEIVINVRYEIEVLPELTTAKYLDNRNILEAMCAFKSNPASTITFYKNFASESNAVFENQSTAEINRFQDGFISKATMRLNMSRGMLVWRIVCVAESDGQRKEAFVSVEFS